ncbi:MAG: SAM-dependent methyltransferase [Verrucomicrobiota bacterium]
MRFDDWMHQCLYHPEHGYYSDPSRRRTGRDGDFITSVSVGAMFGCALALAFVPVWEACGRPEEFWLIEYGAEDGRLAADILASLEAMGGTDFAHAVRYGIVEPAPAKREGQRQALEKSGFGERAEWLEADAAPKPVGVVFGNEVFDAQPVRLVERGPDGWEECCVALAGEIGFAWALCPIEASSEAGRFPARLGGDYSQGYRAELRTRDAELLESMAARLERGLVLAIDYGYPEAELYRPARTAGTLQCYSGHQKSGDPLADPGRQDISAHVNFSQLAREGERLGLNPVAWLTQEKTMAGLLGAFGQHPDVPRLLEGASDPAKATRQFHALLHPELLGSQFHWLWMTKNVSLPISEMNALTFARDSQLHALF